MKHTLSRELPPPATKPAPHAVTTLAPAEGQAILTESLQALPGRPWTASAGEWIARDGGFAKSKEALSFLVFGESAGFRNVRITR